jgi:hypothetical protein
MFKITEKWQVAYPESAIGILALGGVTNPTTHPDLDDEKKKLELNLRENYRGYDRPRLKALPTLQAYNAYYKRFKKSYHVQLQLESVVLKGKSIPSVAALVEAIFMAELKKRNIGTGIHFKAVHTQKYYRETLRLPQGALPATEWNSERICSLPLFPDMAVEDVDSVVAAIKEVLA